MSAIPEEFVAKTAQLSEDVTRPLPGSEKIYVRGSRPDLHVAMREVRLSDTPAMFGAEQNPPVTLYDTSGPYTDPSIEINLLKGLPGLRTTLDRSAYRYRITACTHVRLWTSPPARSGIGAAAFRAPTQATASQVRDERNPDALRAPRDYHTRNGIHRDPGKQPGANTLRISCCVSSMPGGILVPVFRLKSRPSSCGTRSPAGEP